VDSMVYLKLQPYVQSSVLPRSNMKLSFKYVGSFHVLEHVGVVAYRRQHPEQSSIHPVAHVSQLNLVEGFKGTVSSSLPSNFLQ
jgi:hypothetical protein